MKGAGSNIETTAVSVCPRYPRLAPKFPRTRSGENNSTLSRWELKTIHMVHKINDNLKKVNTNVASISGLELKEKKLFFIWMLWCFTAVLFKFHVSKFNCLHWQVLCYVLQVRMRGKKFIFNSLYFLTRFFFKRWQKLFRPSCQMYFAIVLTNGQSKCFNW